MKRKWGITIAILVAVVLIPTGALWLWGRPREHVSLPTADTKPAEVVRKYVRALNERDYDACKRLGIGDGGDPYASWYTLHGPQVRDLRIERVSRSAAGPAAARYNYDSGLRPWHQVVIVSTIQTQVNFTGSGEVNAGNSWSYELVRQASTQPWRIYSAGSP
ncbi:hypothetical protein [Leekyejoonella antrihumi]|uniref:DUF4829 domain-containing protein n=1 Tax=Leekyejoonella antrihumi TaxID=1660198 RepID=A0A563E4V0_9MICO|nr:hypothetical protein [Leekyejoonella antrihumi]TWP37435.1 hypothetical protein FGL98_06730 [Leekyejoonella antrihumi]